MAVCYLLAAAGASAAGDPQPSPLFGNSLKTSVDRLAKTPPGPPAQPDIRPAAAHRTPVRVAADSVSVCIYELVCANATEDFLHYDLSLHYGDRRYYAPCSTGVECSEFVFSGFLSLCLKWQFVTCDTTSLPEIPYDIVSCQCDSLATMPGGPTCWSESTCPGTNTCLNQPSCNGVPPTMCAPSETCAPNPTCYGSTCPPSATCFDAYPTCAGYATCSGPTCGYSSTCDGFPTCVVSTCPPNSTCEGVMTCDGPTCYPIQTCPGVTTCDAQTCPGGNSDPVCIYELLCATLTNDALEAWYGLHIGDRRVLGPCSTTACLPSLMTRTNALDSTCMWWALADCDTSSLAQIGFSVVDCSCDTLPTMPGSPTCAGTQTCTDFYTCGGSISCPGGSPTMCDGSFTCSTYPTCAVEPTCGNLATCWPVSTCDGSQTCGQATCAPNTTCPGVTTCEAATCPPNATCEGVETCIVATCPPNQTCGPQLLTCDGSPTCDGATCAPNATCEATETCAQVTCPNWATCEGETCYPNATCTYSETCFTTCPFSPTCSQHETCGGYGATCAPNETCQGPSCSPNPTCWNMGATCEPQNTCGYPTCYQETCVRNASCAPNATCPGVTTCEAASCPPNATCPGVATCNLIECDSTAASITIGVHQNPVFPSYIQIYVAMDEPLYGDPILAIDDDTLTLSRVSGPESDAPVYRADYELTGGGVLTLSVHVTDRATNISDTTESFVSYPIDSPGGELRSLDGRFRLSVPADMATAGQYLLLFERSDPNGRIYDLRPSDMPLAREARIRFAVHGLDDSGTPVEDYAIFHKDDLATWTQLPAFVDGNTDNLVAFTGRLGEFQIRATGGQAAAPLPRTVTLAQNYPNPFNAGTVIAYTLDATRHVTIDVFNILGEQVVRLRDETQGVGTHEASWDGMLADGRRAPTGLYFYRLTAGNESETRKMLLIK